MPLTTQDFLRRAATAAYERLDLDRRRANEEMSRILDFIRRHLFDPRLDINWMLVGLKLSHNVSSRFRAKMGAGPKRYIEQRRMETARCLLSDSDLEIREIGQLVGYRRFAAFSHAFKQRTGWRPKAYRDAHPPRPQPVEPAEPVESISVDEETKQAARELSRHYGCSASESIRRAVRHLHDAVFGMRDGDDRQLLDKLTVDRVRYPS